MLILSFIFNGAALSSIKINLGKQDFLSLLPIL